MFIKIKEGGNSMSKTIYQYLDKIDHQIIEFTYSLPGGGELSK